MDGWMDGWMGYVFYHIRRLNGRLQRSRKMVALHTGIDRKSLSFLISGF